MPLSRSYANNPDDFTEFEKQMQREVHHVIQPPRLWKSIATYPFRKEEDPSQG